MKKVVRVEAAPGPVRRDGGHDPAGVALLGFLHAEGEGTFGNEGAGHALLLVSSGIATAVPLLLFAAAARRIPLSTMGLLQYVTPLMQLAVGVFVFDEPMPPARLAGFVIVWVALAVFTADSLRHARAGTRRLCRRSCRPVCDVRRRSGPSCRGSAAAAGNCRRSRLRFLPSRPHRGERTSGRS